MYLILLFLHFVGLALGVGASFAFLRLGPVLRDLPPAERGPFFVRVSAISKNGSIGLGLLIATGLGMMSVRGFAETLALGGGAFHAKLGMVVVFCGAFGYMQALQKRVREANGGPELAKIPKVGTPLLLLALGIVGAAVAAFH
jgi:hypothetical protein